MDIQVILTENDPKLGRRGEVIKVSPGYAQNYLFPNHKAKPATTSNLKEFQQEKDKFSKQEAEKLAQARDFADRLKQTVLKLEKATGDGDKLFGSVTSQEILDALAQLGIRCERKQMHLEEPIKKLGRHRVEFKLHPEVQAKLEIEVVKKP